MTFEYIQGEFYETIREQLSALGVPREACVRKGTVTAVDFCAGTVDLELPDLSTLAAVPVYFHCQGTSKASTGNGVAAFSVSDLVIFYERALGTNPETYDRAVVGFQTNLEYCTPRLIMYLRHGNYATLWDVWAGCPAAVTVDGVRYAGILPKDDLLPFINSVQTVLLGPVDGVTITAHANKNYVGHVGFSYYMNAYEYSEELGEYMRVYRENAYFYYNEDPTCIGDFTNSADILTLCGFVEKHEIFQREPGYELDTYYKYRYRESDGTTFSFYTTEDVFSEAHCDDTGRVNPPFGQHLLTITCGEYHWGYTVTYNNILIGSSLLEVGEGTDNNVAFGGVSPTASGSWAILNGKLIPPGLSTLDHAGTNRGEVWSHDEVSGPITTKVYDCLIEADPQVTHVVTLDFHYWCNAWEDGVYILDSWPNDDEWIVYFPSPNSITWEKKPVRCVVTDKNLGVIYDQYSTYDVFTYSHELLDTWEWRYRFHSECTGYVGSYAVFEVVYSAGSCPIEIYIGGAYHYPTLTVAEGSKKDWNLEVGYTRDITHYKEKAEAFVKAGVIDSRTNQTSEYIRDPSLEDTIAELMVTNIASGATSWAFQVNLYHTSH